MGASSRSSSLMEAARCQTNGMQKKRVNRKRVLRMMRKHGLLAAVETSVEDDLSDTMASCSNIPNGMASLNRSVPLP